MNTCPNCNSPVPDDTKFCPNCGSSLSQATEPNDYHPAHSMYQEGSVPTNSVPQGNAVSQVSQEPATMGYQPQQSTYGSTNSYQQEGFVGVQPQYSPAGQNSDVEDNKVMAVLSYLGILCLIPAFGAKNSPFARFHANQGISLAILGVGYPIVKAILKTIFYTISYSFGLTMSSILSIVGGAVSLFVFVLSIMGIVYACKGEMKELPLIGKIKILK